MGLSEIIDGIEGAVVELGALKQAVAELGDDARATQRSAASQSSKAAQTACAQLGTAQHQLGRALVTLLDSVAGDGGDARGDAEGAEQKLCVVASASAVSPRDRARERVAAGFYYGPLNSDATHPGEGDD